MRVSAERRQRRRTAVGSGGGRVWWVRGIAPLLALALAACAGPATRSPAPPPAPKPPARATPPLPGRAPAPARRTPAQPAPIPRGIAPPPGPYAPGFNALHYAIAITLPDTGKYVDARAEARIALVPPYHDTLALDLSGLAVDSVRLGRAGGMLHPTSFELRAGKLVIPLRRRFQVGDTLAVEVRYEGNVTDGLILGPNVHGHFTAFGDNWPNRARYWFPSIDHPSDKATVSFTVNAPAAWTVVANGTRRATGELAAPPAPDTAGPRRIWHWATNVPIPTYTMVIGAGRMVHVSLGRVCGVGGAPGVSCVPISFYAFPEDSANAAAVFHQAPEIVRYFAHLVGPFSYAKLAHVESATIFGGMENASAIFYDQKALSRGRLGVGTVAHETAHQWFGDSVTEASWYHLWLSEGFATYFSALYFEHFQSEARFRAIMHQDAERYFHSPDVDRPVIDTTQTNLLALLNRNNYQKGAWVLHMLRGILGDSVFFHGLQRYYRLHRNGNALTRDLEAAMESVSGRNLSWFFHQWLWEPGYPQLAARWHWDASAHRVRLTLRQMQQPDWPTFRLPLTVAFTTPAGTVERRVDLRRRSQSFSLALPRAPSALTLDPDGYVLMQVESVTNTGR